MKKKLLVASLSIVMMTGCTTHSKYVNETALSQSALASQKTSEHMNAARTEAMNSSKALEKQAVWNDIPVLNTGKRIVKTRLPAEFKNNVTINEVFDVEVKDLFVRVAEMTGIQIMLEPDAMGKEAMESNVEAMSAESGGAPATDSSGATMMPIDMMGGGAATGAANAYMIKISYAGTIEGLMTALSSKLDTKWRYDEQLQKVVFYKYIDEQFYIPSIPGSSKATATLSDTQKGAEFSADTNVWANIKENMDTIVTKGDGGYYTLSESTGTLTVRTTAEGMVRVKSYVDKVKKSLRSQVLVDVQIYSINIEDSENREVNFQALLETNGWGAVFAGGAETALTGANSFIISPLKDSPNVGPGGNYTLKQGSTGMLNILNQAGKTSMVHSLPMRTINNQPVAISATVSDSYLSKSEITVEPESGTQSTSLTTTETKAGLSLNVLPTLDENGRDLMLQVAFSLSDVLKFRTFETTDGSQTVTPVINSRDFIDKVWLQSGQTLMMAGFDLNKTEDSEASPLGSGAWFAGGSKSKKVTKEKLIILITPRVYNAVTQNNF